MRLAIDGQGYASAVDAFTSGSDLAVSVGETLAGRLQGYVGMAGDDATSAEFAASYDEAAAECVAAIGDLAAALRSVAGLAEASLANHRRADAHSVLNGAAGLPSDSVGSVGPGLDVRLPAPPSSLGGDPPALPGAVNWLFDQLEGVVWPNADTDRLRAAAAAWSEAAASVDVLTAHCDTALIGFEGEQSPEIPLAVATTQDLRHAIRQLADQLGSLSAACEVYAAQVDAKREEMLHLLEQLAAELAIGTIVLGGLTVLSAGLAAPAAGAAGAGRLAWAAAELRGIVEALRLATGGTAVGLRPVTVTVKDSRVYLSRLIVSRRAAMTERGSFYPGAYFGRWRPGWLGAHEHSGSHTLRKHVGKSDEELRSRLRNDPGPPAASTFRNRSEAEQAIEATARKNEDAIRDWLGTGRRKRAFVAHVNEPVGRVLLRETGEFHEGTKVRVVLVRDPSMPEGWRVLTAFPDL